MFGKKKQPKEPEVLQPETAEETGEKQLAPRDADNFQTPDDFHYRGPLSYRYLRIMGWLFFAASQIGPILQLASGVGVIGEPNSLLLDFLSILATTMMPLFLLANFSVIMRSRNSYKKLFILYGGLALAIIIGYYAFIERYLFAVVNLLAETPEDAKRIIALIFSEFMGGGINPFLDMFLCTLFSFFLVYRPKKFFQGKLIWLFRSFGILVIAYEVIAFAFKYSYAVGSIELAHWMMPWLTFKPFSVFVVFVVITLAIKWKEHRFLKQGHTLEEYDAHMKTNRHSFHVAIFLAIVFAIGGILDFVANLTLTFTVAQFYGVEASEYALLLFSERLLRAGIGRGITLLPVAPIILLFSYTRDHKNPKIDTFVPIGGILLTIMVNIEGIYFVLSHLKK